MAIRSLKLIGLIGTSALALSACSLTQGYSPSEQEIVADLQPSKYQPATRTVRDNIETQDNFAQAAFWSREYQLNPADLEASIKLASSVRKMGNAAKAVEITQTTRALHPNDPYLAAEYAAALIASERGEEAINPLDNALRAAPGYARLWSLKGAALDQMEDYDLARRHYARALQITPRDPNIMTNMGLSYALAGDPAQAEVWLRRAMAQPGAGPSTRQNLDMIMQLQGKQPNRAEAPQNQAHNARNSYPTSQQNPRASQNQRSYQQPQQRQTQQHSQQNAYSSRQPASQNQYGRAQQPRSTGYGQQYNHQIQRQTPRTQGQPSQYQAQQPTAQRNTSPYASYRTNRQDTPQPTHMDFESGPDYAQQQNYAAPRQQNYGATQQYRAQPSQANRQNAYPSRQTQSYSQSPYAAPRVGTRSNVNAVGGRNTAQQSASDMARAAARQSQSQNRRVVVPAAQTQAKPANILDQIAQNVGPRSTDQPVSAQRGYSRAQTNQAASTQQDYPAPETLRRRRPAYPQNTASPQGYPSNYGQRPQQPYAQQSDRTAPTSRGAARSRR